jgi:hypothetical protein
MKLMNGRLHFGGNDPLRGGFYFIIDGRQEYKLYVNNKVGGRAFDNIFGVPQAMQNVLALIAQKEKIKQDYVRMGYGSEIAHAASFGRDLQMEIDIQDRTFGNGIYLVLPNGDTYFPFDEKGKLKSDRALGNAIYSSWLKDKASSGQLLGDEYGKMNIALSADKETEGSMIFYYSKTDGRFMGANPGFNLQEIPVSVIKKTGEPMTKQEAKEAILNAGKIAKLKAGYTDFRKTSDKSFSIREEFEGANLVWYIQNQTTGKLYKVNPVKSNHEIMTLDELKNSVEDAPAIQNIVAAAKARYGDAALVIGEDGTASLEIARAADDKNAPAQITRLPLYMESKSGKVTLLGLDQNSDDDSESKAAKSLASKPNAQALQKLNGVLDAGAGADRLYDYALALGYKITKNPNGSWTFSHGKYPGVISVVYPVKKDGRSVVSADALESVLRAESYRKKAIENGWTVESTDERGVALTDENGFALWEIKAPAAFGSVRARIYPFDDSGKFSLKDNSLEIAARLAKIKADAQKAGYKIDESRMHKDGCWIISKDGLDNVKVNLFYISEGKLTQIKGVADLDMAMEVEKLRRQALATGLYEIEVIGDRNNPQDKNSPNLGKWIVKKTIDGAEITATLSPVIKTIDGATATLRVMNMEELSLAMEMESFMLKAIAKGYGVVKKTDDSLNQYWEVSGVYSGSNDYKSVPTAAFYPVYKDKNTGEMKLRTLGDIIEAVRVEGLFGEINAKKGSLKIFGNPIEDFKMEQTIDENGYGVWKVSYGKDEHGNPKYVFNLYPSEIESVSKFCLYVEHSINKTIAKAHGADNAFMEIRASSSLGKMQRRISAQINAALSRPVSRHENLTIFKQEQRHDVQEPGFWERAWNFIKGFFNVSRIFASSKAEQNAEERFSQEIEASETDTQTPVTSADRRYSKEDLQTIWNALKAEQEVSYTYDKHGYITEKRVKSVDGIRINDKGELLIVYNEEYLAPRQDNYTSAQEDAHKARYKSKRVESFVEYNGKIFKQNASFEARSSEL